MEDQVDDLFILLLSRLVSDDILVLYNTKKKISIIALTSGNAAIDKNIQKNIREGIYSVVLALPKTFFQLTSMFWLSIMREKSNIFCHQLAYIAIDWAHLIWVWRKFYKEFSNIRILKLLFSKVPIMTISATITPNILEYVQKTLNSKTLIHLN